MKIIPKPIPEPSEDEYPEGFILEKEISFIGLHVRAIAKKFPEFDMVEIGAWKGMSAVIIAKEMQNSNSTGKLYSIDPHDGFLDYVYKNEAPTYREFCINMKKWGVNDIVCPIRKRSKDVKWERPIGLLFIDGLHHYDDIKHDFEKFEPWVVVGGSILVHDYKIGLKWRGIGRYIDREVLPTERFKPIGKRGSTLVLEKIIQ